jgi:hypothetical protein
MAATQIVARSGLLRTRPETSTARPPKKLAAKKACPLGKLCETGKG